MQSIPIVVAVINCTKWASLRSGAAYSTRLVTFAQGQDWLASFGPPVEALLVPRMGDSVINFTANLLVAGGQVKEGPTEPQSKEEAAQCPIDRRRARQ